MHTLETVGDLVSPLGATINAANVIMQLADPGVGQGVVDSSVDSGRADLHPIKRARTTGTYLAVAVFGSDADRAYLREELRKIHARVVSEPNAEVSYSANSPKLQLWVAVCLLKYFIDQHEFLHGPLTEAEYRSILRDGITLATTLNVRPESWPTTRDEYDELWREGVDRISMNDEVRGYLTRLCNLSFLEVRLGRAGRAAHKIFGRDFELITRGALPPEFRKAMHYDWTADDQRRFDRYLRTMRAVHRATPYVWRLLWHGYLVDMRTRRRLGMRVF
ncbi:oxygenase MpaB family protein [Rhodococcus artemisiae]|uniref:Oxygenase MpaB family protein n=1 Tax=Rhodococcus artemisiae TaxID=714159 RepID=A0ABU7LGD3_9NOCA|nr:oxygenase MpaB family protein [Rhodococcus artemisiae]MEE2060617.1 oxygenase MpaB family protein [Rhodococcus artemisiae]